MRPEEYGANGDGIADDTVALRNAIAAASGTGKALELTGTYLVRSIDLTVSNLILQGIGNGSIVSSLPKSTTSPVLWLQGSDIHVRDLAVSYTTMMDIDSDGATVYTNGSNASTIRLGFSDLHAAVSNVSVERCSITGSRNTSIYVAYASGVRVIGNVCQEQGQGICISDCTDFVVSGNRVQRSVDDLIAILADSKMTGATGLRGIITGNVLRQGYAHGIDLTGLDGGVVTGNIIEQTWNPGILIHQYTGIGPTGPDYRLIVANNEIRLSGTYYGAGQYETTAGTANGIDVEGQSNLIIANNNVVGAGSNGIQIAGATDVQVTGNQVQSCGGAGINASPAGSLGITDLLISGNIVQSTNNGVVCLGSKSCSLANVRIANNIIRSYKNGGSGEYRGIFFAYLSNMAITENTIVNDTGGGVAILEYPAKTSSGRIVGNRGPGIQSIAKIAAWPASGSAYVNGYQDIDLFIAGGNVSQISLAPPGGSAVALGITSGTVRLPAMWSITITYTATPAVVGLVQ